MFIGGCSKTLEALDDMYFLYTGREDSPSNQVLHQGKKTFHAELTESFPHGYIIETVIDGKPLRGILFSAKPSSVHIANYNLCRTSIEGLGTVLNGDCNSKSKSSRSVVQNCGVHKQHDVHEKDYSLLETEAPVPSSRNPAPSDLSTCENLAKQEPVAHLNLNDDKTSDAPNSGSVFLEGIGSTTIDFSVILSPKKVTSPSLTLYGDICLHLQRNQSPSLAKSVYLHLSEPPLQSFTNFFVAQLTLRNKISLVTTIASKISPVQRKLFEDTCFRPWLKVQHPGGDAMLTHLWLQTMTSDLPESIKCGNEEIWFHFPPAYTCFGREEFCLITGLRFGHDDVGRYTSHITRPSWLSRVFPELSMEKPNLHVDDLTRLINKKDGFTRMDDVDVVRGYFLKEETAFVGLGRVTTEANTPLQRLTPTEAELATDWWQASNDCNMNSGGRYPPGIGVGRGGGVNANSSFQSRPSQQQRNQLPGGNDSNASRLKFTRLEGKANFTTPDTRYKTEKYMETESTNGILLLPQIPSQNYGITKSISLAGSSRIRAMLFPEEFLCLLTFGFSQTRGKTKVKGSVRELCFKWYQKQSTSAFRFGNYQGGTMGDVMNKSRLSEDKHTRSQLDVSSASKETFNASKMTDNKFRPEGFPPSQRKNYGIGKRALVEASTTQPAQDVVHTGTKEFSTKGCSGNNSGEGARTERFEFNDWWKKGHKNSYWRKSSTIVQRKSGMEDVSRNKHCEVEGVVDEEKLYVLSNCLVGWCKNFIKIGNLANQMQVKGLDGFTIMRPVGNVVLMVFEDSDLLRSVKNYKLETLAKWFSRVKAWSESLVVECRRVWLVYEGVHFHAWNWDTFKNIVTKRGNLLAIDNSCEFPSSFDRAKIQILTKAQLRIDELLELKVGANLFKIMVHEVDPSFKPNSWVPEDCDISLELVPSIGSYMFDSCTQRRFF
ncbi:Transporter associated with antigen processing protein 2 isoform 1 [Hibiscus syriacus]|uniref:Transporter associated with antigen processing protein 2 isoform 1 n=1 Tax=Hibiscus syriacus TaxID=106335 RepID=A0A6A3CTT6_HIBSY|nr:Transporter associated with antigen processing protein 2 isoform 1 [Hibiscus syriacus]